MKLHLFVNYYRDQDVDRREELLTSLFSNVENPYINMIHVFLENSEHASDIESNSKINIIPLGRRMEFKDVFDYVSDKIEDDEVIVISNLDIFLETSDEWMHIGRDFFNIGHTDKTLVCCRHNLDKELKVWKEEESWRRGEFCDVWVLQTPIKQEFLQENLRFCVGAAPQCDNLMMYIMSKYYHTYSWGSKYKVYHYDVCRKREEKQKMILNDKTDMRPSKRKREHICISAYQDWERMLKNKEQPQYVPSWRIVYEDGEDKYYPI